MSTISKEALEEADELWGQSANAIAAALQRHMDATARQAEHTAHYVREAHDQRQRAEDAERNLAAAHELIIHFVTEAGGTVSIPRKAHLDAPHKRISTRVDPLTGEFVITIRDRKPS